MESRGAAPPKRLALAVGLLAAAMLLTELAATRVFSVLFFYHYSFFAISLAMSGLAFGGLIAARWNVRDMEGEEFDRKLAGLAMQFSVGVLVALGAIYGLAPKRIDSPSSLRAVGAISLAFLPGLIAAGAFLAAAFARRESWVPRLYAADLAAAALACVGAVFLMRTVQGPAILLVPAAMTAAACAILAATAPRVRAAGVAVAVVALSGAVGNAATAGRFLRLPVGMDHDETPPIFERWNEHSRIVVSPSGSDRFLVIDKQAGALIPAVPAFAEGDDSPIEDWWEKGVNAIAYRLGRPLDRVAIIGVGGGYDMLAALARGAKKIDGYELNDIQVDLLERDFADFTRLASWPQVELIHSEARVGIRRSGRKYDVIQASLIDTWAATSSGGFVLSENGLYTIEGWETFLDALDEDGVLTMTRWYLPQAPAETHRLLALAAEALARRGIADPEPHIALVAGGPAEDARDDAAPAFLQATILVSMRPFDVAEIVGLGEICEGENLHIVAGPGIPPRDETMRRILDPATRAKAVAESPFDLSPPTDERPYFFLQIRPSDFLRLPDRHYGYVLEITFYGTRILMLMGLLSLAFATCVLAFGSLTAPAVRPTDFDRRLHRRMSLYFLGIGLGYMFVQLGLHQRLILVLGSPTLALSVVLFAMLLGTGVGSAATPFVAPPRAPWRGWLAIVAVLAALLIAFPAIGRLDEIASMGGRSIAVGAIMGCVGFVLGFGFPLGVRLVAPAGELAVQKMWAINGAASIAGSALAAIVGVAGGSRRVVAAGLVCYLLVALCGSSVARMRAGEGEASGGGG